MEAMGAMALLPICESSFTREDYNTYRARSWSPFPLRRAHPGPDPHTQDLERAAIVLRWRQEGAPAPQRLFAPRVALPRICDHTEREFFIDNLLFLIHLFIEMILVDWPCTMEV